MANDERLSVYHLSSDMIPKPVESTISKRCTDKVVMDFVKTLPVPREIFECSKLSVHSTDYKCGQFVILSKSTNSCPLFGKIVKLLSCNKYGYLYVQKTLSVYCPDTDLYFLNDTQQFEIQPCLQLPAYHTLEAYPVGESRRMSLSMRYFVPEHLDS